LANVSGYTFYYYTPDFWHENTIAWHEESANEMSASYLEFRDQLDLLVDSFKVIESALPLIEDSGLTAGEEFTDESLGISLTFPPEWAGLYSTNTVFTGYSEDRTIGTLSINHKATVEWDENSGTLLCIYKIADGEDEYDDDYPPILAMYCWVLDKKDGYTYAAALPYDPIFDELPESISREEYELLKSQLNLLLRSFRIQ
jgi:hypothetical protein